MTALRLTYTFDHALTSNLLTSDFHKYENGQLDSTELLKLATALQVTSKKPRFFSYLAGLGQQDTNAEAMSDAHGNPLIYREGPTDLHPAFAQTGRSENLSVRFFPCTT
jgi:hypothetical protein